MMGEEERRKERGGYREEGAKEERTRPGMASTLRTVSKDDDGVRESVGVGQRFPGQEIPSPSRPVTLPVTPAQALIIPRTASPVRIRAAQHIGPASAHKDR